MNKKGFTIIELIIVIALIAFLSVIAITRVVGSQREFAFINTFKEAILQVKQPRLYSVTNLSVPDEYNVDPVSDEYRPERYGVHITRETTYSPVYDDKYVLTVFADHPGSNEGVYDGGPCTAPPTAPCDFQIGTQYKFDAETYKIEVVDLENASFPDPCETPGICEEIIDPESSEADYVTIFYEPPYAGYGTPDSNMPLFSTPIDTNIALLISDRKKSNTLNRYIIIFNKSGIAEAFYSPAAEELTEEFIQSS